MITHHSIFHGMHQIMPTEIVNQIGEFRGKFLKCSCPYVRGYDSDGRCTCTCTCWECYGVCKHSPFSEYDDYDDYYPYDDDDNYCKWLV